MEWAVSQCKSNATKLRVNTIDSNGTVTFIRKTDYAIKFTYRVLDTHIRKSTNDIGN